jgi:hypothetical protein
MFKVFFDVKFEKYKLYVNNIFSAWWYMFPSRRSMKGETINGVRYEGGAEFIDLCTLISNDNSV